MNDESRAPESAARWVPSTGRAATMAAVLWLATIAGENAGDTMVTVAHHRWLIVPVLLAWAVATRSFAVRCALIVVCGLCGGSAAWHLAALPVEGQCSGIARLVSDPVRFGHGVSAVVEMDSRRYEVLAHGFPARRLSPRLAGESVRLAGRCSALAGDRARYRRVTHIVGRLVPTSVSEEHGEGSMAARASNRIRSALSRGVASMPEVPRSLFMGLVIGDDRDQPRQMIADFRASGLSHLCAVSGQNVAFLLAAAAPLLRRRARHTSWLLTLGLIGWFTLLTRGEPSVLRAGVMAALVATNAAVGRAMNARVVLSMTVCTLLVVDPMLAWNVGFALSAGATAGLAWVSAPLMKVVRVPLLGRRIRGLDEMVATTLAAQIGTSPVAWAVFGPVPVVSMVTNPLAIGVAGAVMMCGLPVALLAAVVPPLESLASFVLALPVRWVHLVAVTGARFGPSGTPNTLLWACLIVAVLGAAAVHRRSGHRRTGGAPAGVGTL